MNWQSLRAEISRVARSLATRPTVTISAGPVVATWAPPAPGACPCPPGEPSARCVKHGSIKVDKR